MGLPTNDDDDDDDNDDNCCCCSVPPVTPTDVRNVSTWAGTTCASFMCDPAKVDICQ